MVKKSSGNYVIAGIVSYGYGCAEPGQPGFYTSVPKLMKWINETTMRSL